MFVFCWRWLFHETCHCKVTYCRESEREMRPYYVLTFLSELLRSLLALHVHVSFRDVLAVGQTYSQKQASVTSKDLKSSFLYFSTMPVVHAALPQTPSLCGSAASRFIFRVVMNCVYATLMSEFMSRLCREPKLLRHCRKPIHTLVRLCRIFHALCTFAASVPGSIVAVFVVDAAFHDL